MHDGAIIISGNKIKSASCFLPLSKSALLDKKYGTRHRAALGLSEITDAIVISVSEANGRVNFWYNSMFLYVKSFNNLRVYLDRLLRTEYGLSRIDLMDQEGVI